MKKATITTVLMMILFVSVSWGQGYYTMFSTSDPYIEYGYSIDSTAGNQPLPWVASGPCDRLFDICGGYYGCPFMGAGSWDTDSTHTTCWIGWWQMTRRYVDGGDSLFGRDTVNPALGFSGIAGVERDPTCTGGRTVVYLTLYDTCHSWSFKNLRTGAVIMADSFGTWIDSTYQPFVVAYELTGNGHTDTIHFDLGNCPSVDTYPIYDVRIVTIRAYPNPTTSLIELDGIANGIVTVKNLLGQVVRCNVIGNVVDFSEQSAGVYYCSVHTRSGSWVETIKVVKQ